MAAVSISLTFFSPLFLLPNAAHAAASQEAACEVTAKTQEVGGFPVTPIDEASGLAMYDGRFYVTNDSGDVARFFRTDLEGKNLEEFRVKDWSPKDVEELTIGPCPSDVGPKGTVCVVLADIGDNRVRRTHVEVAFVPLSDLPTPPAKDQKRDPVEVEAKAFRRFTYPDRAHNAEAFAVLDEERAIIVTKEQDKKSREAKTAMVYVVDIAPPDKHEKGLRKAKKVLELDVPAWVKDRGFGGLVTAMSLARVPATNKTSSIRLALLTYRDAVELSLQPATAGPWSIQSRRVIHIDPLEQQEAIAYDENYDGFYYTSEAPFSLFGYQAAPIRKAEAARCGLLNTRGTP